MNAGEILGGLAVVGVATLVALAITADDDPQSLTSATPTVALGPTAGTSEDASTSTPSTEPTASSATLDPTTTTEAPATTEAPETTASETTEPPPQSSATPATTQAPTTTVAQPLSPEERADVVVRVINGGADTGAAAFVSGVLQTAGFEPIEAVNAAQPVEATWVLFAPGMEREALDANAVIGTDSSRVVPGTQEEPNWSQFGPFVDVLVVLGPS